MEYVVDLRKRRENIAHQQAWVVPLGISLSKTILKS
jgi:hypothetical protein